MATSCGCGAFPAVVVRFTRWNAPRASGMHHKVGNRDGSNDSNDSNDNGRYGDDAREEWVMREGWLRRCGDRSCEQSPGSPAR